MESCHFSCSKDKDYREKNILETFKKFRPLIKKYTRKLNYDGAETDLVIALIQVLDKMPLLKEEYLINGYIIKSLWNEYIRLSKKSEFVKTEVPLQLDFFGKQSNIDLDIKIDIQNALKNLSIKQKKVIEQVFYLEYSEAEIARYQKITRQAISKTKRKALNRLRRHLKNIYC